MKVTTDAVQVLGGYGYTQDFPVERYMREAKVTQIFEGTNQIQRLVIARQLAARLTVRPRPSPAPKGKPLQINAPPSALVTGGASGLGDATVRRLHDEGAAVVIVDLPASHRAALAEELGEHVVFVPPTCATRRRCRPPSIAAAASWASCGSW